MEDADKNWYDIINSGLLRRRKTGSSATKKLIKTGSFNSPYSSRKDSNGQILPPKKILSDQERDEILAAHFEVVRVRSYEEVNEHREHGGLEPWYILTKEELDLVGLVIHYSLCINPRREYVREMIRLEGQRLQELREKGAKATPWSTWKDRSN